ncbi:unnamed protein product [Urochloa decumbens]|uniref:Protein kinase domain-containing protein n=1 Tax=Urochloa decumbens TaxID=240449 RepID=A0ABC9AJV7_9POAL
MRSSTVSLIPQSAKVLYAAAMVALVSWLLLSPAAATQIGLPGCPTKCGNVSVPYPFGISPRCYLPGFKLTCDTSQTPPQLLLGDGSMQVTNISLNDSTVHVIGPGMTTRLASYSSEEYVWNGTWGGPEWGLIDGGPYVLAEDRNEFILISCNYVAKLMIGGGNRTIINGCASFCYADNNGPYVLGDGTSASGNSTSVKRCSGVGCCQVPIIEAASSYVVYVLPLENNRDMVEILLLIAEQGWFGRFSADMLFDLWNGMGIPMVLAWAVTSTELRPNETRDGDDTCPKDLGSNTCHSTHSSCTSSLLKSPYSNHTGSYTCKCWEGYEGNPYLSDGCQGIGSGAVLLFVVLGTTFIIRKVKSQRKKKLRQRFFNQNRGQLLQQLVCQRVDIAERMIITLKELEKATNNFDKARELGGGGHGTVYKGILSSLHVVAIKKSKIVVQREINDFINEVAILSQINHRNIVKLLGCCLEIEVPVLVYEFITNGTLYHHLHVEAPLSLPWKDRLRIGVETARALAYLHSFVSMPVIHRDIKSPNILLEDNLRVKLSDFGASRYIPIDQTGVDTVVQGTFGYLDPTYYSTGHLTEKSDVYSFGVILIELLTRKKPVSYRSAEGYGLVKHYVTLLSEGKLDHILDPQITREGDGEVIDVALLAAICVKFTREERPTMRQVEMTLESIHAAKECVSSDVADDESDKDYCTWRNGLVVGGTDMDDMRILVDNNEAHS